jgi:DNA-binding CsgD family transcriptional regulator
MCDELPCSPRAAASLYRRVAALSRRETDVGVGNAHASGSGGPGNAHANGSGVTGNAHANGAGNAHASRIATGPGNRGAANFGLPLSPRELQIAQLIDCGLTNKQIGRELGIEAATVKNHVHNMCEKLDVHRRGEAAARIRAISRARAQLSTSAPGANPALEAT